MQWKSVFGQSLNKEKQRALRSQTADVQKCGHVTLMAPSWFKKSTKRIHLKSAALIFRQKCHTVVSHCSNRIYFTLYLSPFDLLVSCWVFINCLSKWHREQTERLTMQSELNVCFYPVGSRMLPFCCVAVVWRQIFPICFEMVACNQKTFNDFHLEATKEWALKL